MLQRAAGVREEELREARAGWLDEGSAGRADDQVQPDVLEVDGKLLTSMLRQQESAYLEGAI